MKYLFFYLIIAQAAFCANSSMAAGRVSLDAGTIFFSDVTGYYAGAEYRIDAGSLLKGMPAGLFFGLDANYMDINYSASNFTQWNVNGALEAGYTVTLVKDFIYISPLVKAGAGYLNIADTISNFGSWGFVLTPAVCLDFSLTPDFSLGLETGYSFFVNSLFNENTLIAALTISYIFPSEKEIATNFQIAANTNVQIARSRSGDSGSNTQIAANAQIAGDSVEDLGSHLKDAIKEQNIWFSVEEESSNRIKLSLSDVLFETDSDKIDHDYYKMIKSIVGIATNYSSLSVLVEGYTDDQGDEDYNYRLSADRAKNVSELFIAYGMLSTRVSYRGRGKEDPLVPNTSAENRKRNRRVEIMFIINP